MLINIYEVHVIGNQRKRPCEQRRFAGMWSKGMSLIEYTFDHSPKDQLN